MTRSKSSSRWLKEHFKDKYVKQSQQEGYHSRAAYKLLEIQEKDQIIKPKMIVVDLGAAPGGWSQVVVKCLKNQGQIIALDVLPLKPVSGVQFIQGDILEDQTLKFLMDAISGKKVDLVLSDMAPNISGIKDADQARSLYLAEIAFDFATKVLTKGGAFVVKVFQGCGFDDYLRLLRKHFDKVAIRKPKASKDRSPEIYFVAKGFKED